MKKWNRILAAVLTLSLTAGLTACGGSKPAETTAAETKAEAAEVMQPQIMQVRQTREQHPMEAAKFTVLWMRSKRAVRSISAFSPTKIHLDM